MDKQTNEQKLQGKFSDSLGYLLSRSSRLFREKLSKALIPLELSLHEYVTLRLVSFNTPMSQGILGEQYGIDRTTMVGVIDNLEARGLVARERNTSDRRSYRLLLSIKGRKLLSRALRIATTEQQQFLSPLSASEWDQIRECLARLIECNSLSRPLDK
jgi:DNA-binding MarR family transcriptional regulator